MRVKGDLTKAWEFIREALAVKGLNGSSFAEAMIACAAAEVIHGLGDDRQAEQYLDHVQLIGDEMGSFNLQFRGYLLESQFAFDQGREEVGLAALRRALAIGRERGFIFFHWFLPKTMARICAKALEADIEVEYVQNLIRKTRLVPDGSDSISKAWPWPVKIYTLGRFEIHVDGKPLPPRRKAPYRMLTLLKAMIAMGGHDIPVSRLIDALWPETEGDTGSETLHKTLQRLRRFLNHDSVIQVRENKASLNRQVCWVDALAFDDLLSHRDRTDKKESDETATWVKTYEQAVQLYRGHFLDGDETTWAQARQDRLRRKFLDATERLRVYWTELGDSTRMAHMTRRMHEVEPAEVE